ncbi:transmembrane protein 272-like [Macrosteles quadrilineatus]|uniref:transmembrane protein 272-like n=1 Tax=Macrosteles quadrilineatus TaxID=74068 RepID=UPI0023E21DAE|nr:transmembrane protein 272-like [Macrosteles quadrilineatus]XP_054269787.1 transmembrane protein 272-like [Macrosteles quadrilineatus]
METGDNRPEEHVEAGPSTSAISAPPSYHGSPAPDKGPPPSYEEAIDPNAPPPSYDSLFGRVREVRKSSSGFLDFFKNLTILLIGTIGCGVVFTITFVIPVSMIVVGLVYLHECPNSEYIPIFLLVGGGFGVLKQLLHLSAQVRVREEEREQERLRQTPTQTLISCFMLGWFIIGSMWVYGASQPSFDRSNPHYCNRFLYTFALGLVTSVYISLAAVIMCMCSASAVAFVYQAHAGSQEFRI